MIRRRMLALLGLGGLALAGAPAARANGGRLHVRLGQQKGQFTPLSPDERVIVAWPTTSEEFPDSRGVVSADRTSVLLADPGAYLVTWALTLGSGDGRMRKCSLLATGPDGLWHVHADGTEVAPVEGSRETTLVGTAWVRSDGSRSVQLTVNHDAERPITLTDRSYEAFLDVAWLHE